MIICTWSWRASIKNLPVQITWCQWSHVLPTTDRYSVEEIPIFRSQKAAELCEWGGRGPMLNVQTQRRSWPVNSFYNSDFLNLNQFLLIDGVFVLICKIHTYTLYSWIFQCEHGSRKPIYIFIGKIPFTCLFFQVYQAHFIAWIILCFPLELIMTRCWILKGF